MVNAEVISVGLGAGARHLRRVDRAARHLRAGRRRAAGQLGRAAAHRATGAVAGVVFARAEADADRGYAMTTAELRAGAAPRRRGCSEPVVDGPLHADASQGANAMLAGQVNTGRSTRSGEPRRMQPGTEGASLPANLSGIAYRSGSATLESDPVSRGSADGESSVSALAVGAE